MNFRLPRRAGVPNPTSCAITISRPEADLCSRVNPHNLCKHKANGFPITSSVQTALVVYASMLDVLVDTPASNPPVLCID